MDNWIKKEQLQKVNAISTDGAYRDGNPRLPVQPVMSYRFGDRGSDTMRPELKNGAIYNKTGASPYTPPNRMGTPYRTVGGIKFLKWEDCK